MFRLLKRLYNEKRLPKANLKIAVSDKGWISADEFKQITGEEYE